MTYSVKCNDAVQANAQVADGVAVAVENGLERRDRRGSADSGSEPDGGPALARVPVCIAGVGVAAAVGIEVQVGGQLVAVTSRAGAAHPGQRGGKGGVVVVGMTPVVNHPVAVKVPPDGVQLGQAGHLDQTVVIGVIVLVVNDINCLGLSGRRRPRDDRQGEKDGGKANDGWNAN